MLRIISIYSDRGRFYVDREIIKSFLRNVLIEWQKDELIIWSKRRVCGGRFYDNLWTRPQRYHTWHILDYVLYFNNIYIVCAVWESRPVVIDVGSVEMAAFIKFPEFHWVVGVELLSLSCCRWVAVYHYIAERMKTCVRCRTRGTHPSFHSVNIILLVAYKIYYDLLLTNESLSASPVFTLPLSHIKECLPSLLATI